MCTQSRRFRSTQLFIAWFLIGLMTGGALVHYLSVVEDRNVCLEERILESEDGRCDLWDDLAVAPQFIELTQQQELWVLEASLNDLRCCFAIRDSHLERGPPVLTV